MKWWKKMSGAFMLCFLLTTVSSVAQTDRCTVLTTDSLARFENWISSRSLTSAREKATVYKIPVVVHILHRGYSEGEGFNFPKERIIRQIKTLNEDFRRKKDTPGFNGHPDGTDSYIEFMLAETDPDGNPTDGIVRVDMTSTPIPPGSGDVISTCAKYSYWDPEKYLNVWSLETGLPPGLLLGSARFPITDLDGLKDEVDEVDGDGVFINALNFGSGETNTDPNYNTGRTLTHEIGHFLGLLHTWGSINNSRQCDAYTDYCNDTPPIPMATDGCPEIRPQACDGRPAMIENYMDGTYDQCMNIFTRNQTTRMRTILENSPRRKSLTSSDVIDRGEVITGIPKQMNPLISVYPNPATEKIYVSKEESMVNIRITVRTLLGQVLSVQNSDPLTNEMVVPLDQIRSQMVILVIEADGRSYSYLIHVQ